ncbi:MAG: hypothetical protein IT364_16750 [Candidatus Hydrogenedentes bacterium]|nr:hypothetical protein [Candidatus Hydrogenedentota bacterium]
MDPLKDKLEATVLHGGPGEARCVVCKGQIKAREARWYGKTGAVHARGACCRRVGGKDNFPYIYVVD